MHMMEAEEEALVQSLSRKLEKVSPSPPGWVAGSA